MTLISNINMSPGRLMLYHVPGGPALLSRLPYYSVTLRFHTHTVLKKKNIQVHRFVQEYLSFPCVTYEILDPCATHKQLIGLMFWQVTYISTLSCSPTDQTLVSTLWRIIICEWCCTEDILSYETLLWIQLHDQIILPTYCTELCIFLILSCSYLRPPSLSEMSIQMQYL